MATRKGVWPPRLWRRFNPFSTSKMNPVVCPKNMGCSYVGGFFVPVSLLVMTTVVAVVVLVVVVVAALAWWVDCCLSSRLWLCRRLWLRNGCSYGYCYDRGVVVAWWIAVFFPWRLWLCWRLLVGILFSRCGCGCGGYGVVVGFFIVVLAVVVVWSLFFGGVVVIFVVVLVSVCWYSIRGCGNTLLLPFFLKMKASRDTGGGGGGEALFSFRSIRLNHRSVDSRPTPPLSFPHTPTLFHSFLRLPSPPFPPPSPIRYAF